MTLIELSSEEALVSHLKTHSSTLVCFSATWCGPCKQSKPALEELASEYGKRVDVSVPFGIAYEHNVPVEKFNIRAFPTYVLFLKGSEAGRIEGANLDKIREMIEDNAASCQQDEGQTLGSSSSNQYASAQEARLARFANPNTNNNNTTLQDVEMKDAESSSANDELFKTLTEQMGFTNELAKKGLENSGNNLEGAIEWIAQHQEDTQMGGEESKKSADDDADPNLKCKEAEEKPKSTEAGITQSYKCNECGKILSNMANLELHANKTGHSDFAESTEAVKPLTEEEKKAKVEEIKLLLKAKREERENTEKQSEKDREKQRRFMGKEMAKTREQMEIDQRKHQLARKKREKEAYRKERERIRAELAKDKAERIANKGKLSSKLGVDGYNPDGIQYDVDNRTEAPQPDSKPKKSGPNVAKIDDYIKKVSSYRAGGDGGKCLKILLAYIRNVVDNPDESKFKTINTDNKVYKLRVKPLIGAKSLLLAVGFQPQDDKLVLSPDADMAVLTQTKEKLAAAHTSYTS